jgi:hypothetical protein
VLHESVNAIRTSGIASKSQAGRIDSRLPGNSLGTMRPSPIDFASSTADTDHASFFGGPMNDQRGRGFEEFGRKVDEKVTQAMPRLEEDVKKVIAYLNNEVVPDVRRNSVKALRLASEQLAKLAEGFERHAGGGSSGGSR